MSVALGVQLLINMHIY